VVTLNGNKPPKKRKSSTKHRNSESVSKIIKVLDKYKSTLSKTIKLNQEMAKVIQNKKRK
jgi:hypothetical protein